MSTDAGYVEGTRALLEKPGRFNADLDRATRRANELGRTLIETSRTAGKTQGAIAELLKRFPDARRVGPNKVAFDCPVSPAVQYIDATRKESD